MKDLIMAFVHVVVSAMVFTWLAIHVGVRLLGPTTWDQSFIIFLALTLGAAVARLVRQDGLAWLVGIVATAGLKWAGVLAIGWAQVAGGIAGAFAAGLILQAAVEPAIRE